MDDENTVEKNALLQKLAALEAQQAELRRHLDTILERLEAVPQAQTTLDEAHRAWFAQTLRQELAALGNLARFEAHLTGWEHCPGTRSSGGWRAWGSRENIQGSIIITGDNVTYTGQAQSDPGAALAAYRRVLVTSCRHLPLRGVDVRASDPTRGQQPLDLARVYVDLHTTTSIPRADGDQRTGGENVVWGETTSAVLWGRWRRLPGIAIWSCSGTPAPASQRCSTI